jgi:hypothetical protein
MQVCILLLWLPMCGVLCALVFACAAPPVATERKSEAFFCYPAKISVERIGVFVEPQLDFRHLGSNQIRIFN